MSKPFMNALSIIKRRVATPSGGGRVTEILIRPLFSLFFPELTGRGFNRCPVNTPRHEISTANSISNELRGRNIAFD